VDSPPKNRVDVGTLNAGVHTADARSVPRLEQWLPVTSMVLARLRRNSTVDRQKVKQLIALPRGRTRKLRRGRPRARLVSFSASLGTVSLSALGAHSVAPDGRTDAEGRPQGCAASFEPLRSSERARSGRRFDEGANDGTRSVEVRSTVSSSLDGQQDP